MQITSNILDKRHIRPKGVPSNEEFQAFSMRINANFNDHRITVMVDHGSFIKHYTIDRWD